MAYFEVDWWVEHDEYLEWLGPIENNLPKGLVSLELNIFNGDDMYNQNKEVTKLGDYIEINIGQ